jgi:hypothetical protein
MQIILTSYLIGGLLLIDFQSGNTLVRIFINVVNLYSLTYDFGLFLVGKIKEPLPIILPVFILLIIGGMSINKIPVFSKFNRN